MLEVVEVWETDCGLFGAGDFIREKNSENE